MYIVVECLWGKFCASACSLGRKKAGVIRLCKFCAGGNVVMEMRVFLCAAERTRK